MAKITLNTDDISGETLPDGNPTTTVVVKDERGGLSFEIDLSDTNFKALLKALDKYTAKGRPVEKTAVTTDKEAAAFRRDARLWAIASRPDLKVAERGAVPQAALDAYREYLAANESE